MDQRFGRLFDEFFAPSAELPVAGGADPFGIDHNCTNPAGHDFISSCGDVACVHCGRIAWR